MLTKAYPVAVITKRPSRSDGQPPIVLVHGGWHGAWCWDMGFMDRLVDHGFECHALNLRGHGDSEGHARLRRHRISGYVDDLRGVVEGLDRPPVLVGHSMGGFVVQKYLETWRAVGAVLLAPVPHTGILPMFLRFAASDPLAVAKCLVSARCRPVMEGQRRVARRLFSGSTSEAVIRACADRIQDESFSVFLELLFSTRVRPDAVQDPVAVIGAARDGIFPVSEIEAVARAYGIEADILDGIGHDMMLDTRWEDVADFVARNASAFGTQEMPRCERSAAFQTGKQERSSANATRRGDRSTDPIREA